MDKFKVNSKRRDPYKNFNFRVVVDGRNVEGLNERSAVVDLMASAPGATAVFVGEKGSGKKTAAEAIAAQLGRDLHRVELSSVASKYIGETEKNLERVLQAAKDSDAVIFFDEADALFGKRTEVKDSHDRYANLDIGYLLQRLEDHPGLAILATNMKSSLDQAFIRRLRYVVEFPPQ